MHFSAFICHSNALMYMYMSNCDYSAEVNPFSAFICHSNALMYMYMSNCDYSAEVNPYLGNF